MTGPPDQERQELQWQYPTPTGFPLSDISTAPQKQLPSTVDGLETHFAVNHLGHFAVTLPLVPITKRVVVTSSGAANEATEPLPFDKLANRDDGNNYDAMHAYADSKLANVLFARGLKHRCPELEVVATHPGFVVTDLQRHSLKFRILGRFLAQSAEREPLTMSGRPLTHLCETWERRSG